MKYKVGDRVRILPRAKRDSGAEYVGFIGDITWVHPHFGYYSVKMNDGISWILGDTEIELVEEKGE